MSGVVLATRMRSTAEVAAEIGVDYRTVSRWAADMNRTSGRGYHARWMPTDLKVARAWSHVTDRQQRALIRQAVWQRRGSRWLLVCDTAVIGFDTVDEAARWWVDSGQVFAQLIDLDPDNEETT